MPEIFDEVVDSTTDDDSEFEAMGRAAGAALRRSAPDGGAAAATRSGRRRQALAAAAIGVVVVLLVGGGLALRNSADGTHQPAASTTLPAPLVPKASAALVFSGGPDAATSYGSKLWTFRGSALLELFEDLPGQQLDPAWSPDGTLLVFTRTPSTTTFDGSRLYTSSEPHLQPRQLDAGCAPPTCTADIQAGFSPDGRRLAFVRRFDDDSNGIGIVDTSGGTALILDHVQMTKQYSITSPRWSPDGRSIVFAGTNAAFTKSSLYILSVDTGSVRRLTPPDVMAFSPDWSSTGTIVFAIELDHRVNGNPWVGDDLSIIAPDGTGLRTITTDTPYAGKSTMPRWTRDGSRLVFALLGDTVPACIWAMNPDGSDAAPATPACTSLQDSPAPAPR